VPLNQIIVRGLFPRKIQLMSTILEDNLDRYVAKEVMSPIWISTVL
jgi:hypothetical protein